MITPTFKTLSIPYLKTFQPEDVLYAELTPPGAMGRTGSMIYVLEEDQLNCYQVSPQQDETTYKAAEEWFYKYLDKSYSADHNPYFKSYYGGAGNSVINNKNIELEIEENYFVYKKSDKCYQIMSSVQGIFEADVRGMKSR